VTISPVGLSRFTSAWGPEGPWSMPGAAPIVEPSRRPARPPVPFAPHRHKVSLRPSMRTAYTMATQSWFVVIFQVTSREKQQEVLRFLQRTPRLTALGTFQADDYFIVFECEDQATKRSAEVLVEGIDPGCIQTFETHSRRQLGSSG